MNPTRIGYVGREQVPGSLQQVREKTRQQWRLTGYGQGGERRCSEESWKPSEASVSRKRE